MEPRLSPDMPPPSTAAAGVAGVPRLADILIRARAIYSMAPERTINRAIAICDEWIVAVDKDPHGLDGLIAPDAQMVDDPTLLPAFYDTHLHLLEAARTFSLVPANQATPLLSSLTCSANALHERH